MGVASLILGIISFLVSFSIFKDFSLICGVIAIVLGIIAIVKKKGKGMALAGVILSVIGLIVLFSNSSTKNTGKITSNDSVTTDSTDTTASDTSNTTDDEQTLKVGDTWTVDGQWTLTIDSVQTTSDRNQYADVNPAQVVIVTYSYENIGYKDDVMDGLYFDLGQNGDATTIDATGEVAVSYPGDVTTYPQTIPVGAKCSGAQACIGLMNESDTITMNITKYDSNGTSQSVKCNLKVD